MLKRKKKPATKPKPKPKKKPRPAYEVEIPKAEPETIPSPAPATPASEDRAVAVDDRIFYRHDPDGDEVNGKVVGIGGEDHVALWTADFGTRYGVPRKGTTHAGSSGCCWRPA